MTTANTPTTHTATWPIVKRLWRTHIVSFKTPLLYAALLMILGGACTAIHAWIIQPVLDEVFLNQNQDMLLILPIVILLVTAVKGASSFGHEVILKRTGQRIVSDMQFALFRHLTSSDVAFFTNTSSGNLISKFTNDIEMIRRNLAAVLLGVARESITLTFLVGVMFYQSVSLSLIAFVGFPLAIYPITRLGKRMRKISRQTQEQWARFTSTLDDIFKGIRIVKAYHMEETEIAKAKEQIDTLYGHYAKAAKVDSLASPMMEMLGGFAIAAVIWYGGNQVLAGHTTPGAFFSFITALMMAYRPLKALSKLNNALQEGSAAAERYFHVMDQQPAIASTDTSATLSVKNPSIEFNNISFHYGDTPAIQNLSLAIEAGQHVALVGRSGSGKTTLTNLLLRFFDPQKGTITIDNTNIRDVTLESLRQHIAIVTQDTFLFDDTVRANISYGSSDATDDAIEHAATQAAAHEFISTLPEGYDTKIGPYGSKLSGGQRQRIAIARAMLKNAPILLLDEATSALDTESEAHVQQALNTLMQNRTTLVIAHRLSTVQHADCIYVIDQGSIAEQGTHETLLQQNGIYANLCKNQLFEA